MISDLGIQGDSLPWVNRSAADDDLRRAALSDPDVRRAVLKRFAEDYERFGY